jgi:hypothetical protein
LAAPAAVAREWLDCKGPTVITVSAFLLNASPKENENGDGGILCLPVHSEEIVGRMVGMVAPSPTSFTPQGPAGS